MDVQYIICNLAHAQNSVLGYPDRLMQPSGVINSLPCVSTE